MHKYLAPLTLLALLWGCKVEPAPAPTPSAISFHLSSTSLQGGEPISILGFKDGAFLPVVSAKSLGAGEYSFEPASDASGAKWYPVFEGAGKLTVAKDGTVSIGLPSVLEEGALGPVFGGAIQEGKSSASEVFSTLQARMTGLEASEKIMSASLTFSQAASTIASSALNGDFVLSPEGESLTIKSVQADAMSNSVSVVSASGIAAKGGAWTCSFVAKPFTLRGKVSLVVATQSNLYSLTIPLDGALALEQGATSSLTFDLSSAEKLPCATQIPAVKDISSYVLPVYSGKKIVSARMLLERGQSQISYPELTLKAGDRKVLSVKPSMADGGAVSLPLPAGYASMSGFVLESSYPTTIRIASYALEDNSDEPLGCMLVADGNDSGTYDLIHACGYEYETPDNSGAHSSAPVRHITQSYDSSLGKYVFNFILHIQNDDDRGLANVKDRQRNEIKTDAKSPATMVAQKGETLRMKWKFRLPEGMKTTSNFAHVHQLKGIDNAAGTADVSQPLVTYTARSKNGGQVLQVIYVYPSEANKSNEYLAECNLADFLGQWVEVCETVTFDTPGSYSTVITRISDQKVLVKIDGVKKDLWRTGTTGLRPKWGLYRYFGDSRSLASSLRDETLNFADFSIEKLK
ncbi:MAG: hypothetical protein MJY67_00460 [Bacteroidales bacterium]|nr:hypothetical protein [Bacteroidales bacterium]